ncbi:hypothetical protein JXL21_14555 [Candidatus Bathyarchaeota archaeon]|nr:hypothetical protein [Candidatus Bathyarchaeota archaeon]
MATSVKISREYKDRLDRLQAKLLLATGAKLSQQELLELLVLLGTELEDEIVKRLNGLVSPLGSEAIREILARTADWGVETSEDTINETLYGG